MANIEQMITRFLEPLLQEYNYYLVELKGLPGHSLQVYLDADESVTVGSCAHINKALKRFLEEEGLLGDDFSIEVSSPGIGHPLDGEVLKGKLVSANEDSIVVEHPVKKEDAITTELSYEEISKTIIQVKF